MDLTFDALTVKLGGWVHLGRFNDYRRSDPQGGSSVLADPAGSGVARRLRDAAGLYAILDQLVFREAGTVDQGLAVFARVSAAPNDRNLVNLYLDGGLTYKGLFPGRVNDTLGLSVGYARISDSARGFDLDKAGFNPGAFTPIRSSELVFEATYQAQVVPGFTIQPDLQYIVRPGAGIANPRDPAGAPIRNATVLGVRATIRY